jgi:DNA-3-methyladenine glycosylase
MKNSFEIFSKLPHEFYNRNLLTVAKDLLGKVFVHNFNDKLYAGIIVEVEAYDGRTDEAAHSFGGITKRNKIMFEEGGLLYVYFVYGIHYCCNVVTGPKGIGNAVLIRGIQPMIGLENMLINRFGKIDFTDKHKLSLTNGPAKITKAFAIDKRYNGTDLNGDEIYLCSSNFHKKNKVTASTRIGIKKSVELPWRFYIKDNPYVSKK